MKRQSLILLTLTAATPLALLLALTMGSVPIGLSATLSVLAGGGEELHRLLIWELRLPRVLAAFVTGGLLAMAGALMQVLLRNPLADPYVLGLSGGAAVGALLSMLAGWGFMAISGSAFVGALLSAIIVFGLAHGTGSWTPTRLLLTGVVVAAGWGALISFLLAITPSPSLPGMLFWLMGDLSHARGSGPAFVLLAAVMLVALPMGRHLNVLARGPLQAAALGVNVRPLEWGIYVVAALLTASAVTLAGAVGFVGLIVPHMLRLVLGNDQRIILPASALLGGILLTLADTAARTVIAPQQLPVGVITALLGVPVFLYLLHRSR
ncbi:iron complex transport system permease protein [Ectothiorhodosinus mongolicus]|uniref:Iron complex transport system permease protein n=1 Tax=Ectothiorhodosinus mongolicus TaxID=233100 RepID=A0A1R3W4K3_9GAMM|nr:iron ABC transporter permease [Ectothiorhodosinus mongolicus]ULX57548.1 iron ABC transporter permease [Ectothiorhodosinus mongolicus]SIT72747.1 iron complex transport system permease protein [Ectothiorhodosinus mongolicus]